MQGFGTNSKILKELVISVKPTSIKYFVKSNKTFAEKKVEFMTSYAPEMLLKKNLNLGFLSVSDEHFGQRVDIESESVYAKTSDLILNIDDYSRSKWYQAMLAKLHKNKQVVYKGRSITTGAELDVFFKKYVVALVNDIKVNGYQENKAPDVGTLRIDKDGELCKSANGRHRFAIARALGVESIPLRVVAAHKEWMESNSITTYPQLVSAVTELSKKYV